MAFIYRIRSVLVVNSHDTHFLLLTNLSGTFAGSTCTPTSLSSMLLAALTWVLGSSWVLNTWLPPTFLLNTPTERIKYQRGFYFDIKKHLLGSNFSPREQILLITLLVKIIGQILGLLAGKR